MGFGGVGSMNVVLKNNRKLLPKRDRFKRQIADYKNVKIQFKVNSVQPHKLKRIKTRLQNEQKHLMQKRLFVFGLLMVVLLTVILYFM